MAELWFTELADELAQCLTDAEVCATACETLLESVDGQGDAEVRRTLLAVLIAPAAISRVLGDLIDQPPQLVLAACRLCSESCRAAAAELERLGPRLDSSAALPALRTAADSCEVLLDAMP
jgi:hypothetical protein